MRVHRCPQCRHKGPLYGFKLIVRASADYQLTQTFTKLWACNTATEMLGTPTWSGESPMECDECGHRGKAVEFGCEYFPLVGQVTSPEGATWDTMPAGTCFTLVPDGTVYEKVNHQ